MKNISEISIPYTNNASLKLRYLAVQKFHEGHSRTAIAKIINVSRRLVNEWISKYLSGGFDALALKKATGYQTSTTLADWRQLTWPIFWFDFKASFLR